MNSSNIIIFNINIFRQSAVPPPPPVEHNIPSTRLKSEISERKAEPPLCVQNAMLTKDKKPFTYTPGGIDLSEIRSPRMAKRLERNAMSEGVTPSQHPQNHYSPANLPPSALAAMQPQLQVQVFPTGKIPQLHHHGSAPPPPPPPSGNIPPPPPKAPPLNLGAPLPTDPFDRPDMTKIIPENPMALLRKTSGPVIKLDPIFNKENYNKNGNNYSDRSVNFNNTHISADKPSNKNLSFTNNANSGVGSIYIPPLSQNNAPSSPYKQPQSPQFVDQNIRHEESNNSEIIKSPPPYYKRQPSIPPSELQQPISVQRQQSLNSSSRDSRASESPKPLPNKAPTTWLTQQRQHQDAPKWATNEQSKTIPPSQEYQTPIKDEREFNNYPHNSQQPSTWSQRQPDTQAWQQKLTDQQQENQPSWRQNQQYSEQPEQRNRQQQQQQPYNTSQSHPVQVSQKGLPRQVHNRENLQACEPSERVEVVIVNDPPYVFQHPGQPHQRITARQCSPQQATFAQKQQQQQQQYQNQQQQQYPIQSNTQNVRIIPIKVEGSYNNGHDRYNNGDGRSYNRQQSWSANPTQSSTFKVLQKITQTDDGGDDEVNQIITEHSPKSQHQFPQRQMSSDQSRRFNENGNDNINRLIPGSPNRQIRSPGPQIRTIPIQIEGENLSKTYVPPSEQTVQEPKKYMGSSIPSRSFKMLQAMTGPEECAKTSQDCENNEIYSNNPSQYSEWRYNSNNYPLPAPYYFDPYWGYYPYSTCKNEPIVNNSSQRTTPVPFGWRYTPPNYSLIDQSSCDNNVTNKSTNISNLNGDAEASSNKNNNIKHRATPVPQSMMNYYPNNYQYENKTPNSNCLQMKESSVINNDQVTYQCPQYWDPYYYYYGMPPPPLYPPPIYSPYPFYHPQQQSDVEEISGYSSTDEMSYYGARFASMPPFNNPKQKQSVAGELNSFSNSEVHKDQNKENIKNVNNNTNKNKRKENGKEIISNIKIKIEDDSSVTSDSDSEMTGYEVCRLPVALQAIRSVSNIKVYDEEGSSCCSEDEQDDNDEDDEESNNSDDNDTLSVHTTDETIPHQLSVIYEESERADSDMRCVREASVASTISEDTRTVENSENEEELQDTVIVKLPLTLNFTVDSSQKIASITVGNSEIVNSGSSDNNFGQSFVNDNYKANCDNIEFCFDEDKSNTVPNSSQQIVDNTDCDDTGSEVDWWGQIERTDSSTLFRTKKLNSTWERDERSDNSCDFLKEEEEELENALEYHNIDNTIITVTNDDDDYIRSVDKSIALNINSHVNKDKPEVITDMESTHCHDIESTHCHAEENYDFINGNKSNTFHNHNYYYDINNDNVNNSSTNSCKRTLEDIPSSSMIADKCEDVDFWAEIISANDTSSKQVEKIVKEKIYEDSVCSSDSSTNSSDNLNSDAYQSLKHSNDNTQSDVKMSKGGFYNETESKIHSIKHESSISDKKEMSNEDYQMPSIQDRIKALHANIISKHIQKENEIDSGCDGFYKNHAALTEDNNETLSIERSIDINKQTGNSRKSSIKSYDDYSEEDGDSGVTSDVSKHISEIDTETEYMDFKRVYQYQRASTHSRLFKLLQGDCEEDDNEDDDDDVSTEFRNKENLNKKDNMHCRREHLNLPLNKLVSSDPESFSSSGFTSPGSPIINEKLIGDLIIQSLLQNKNFSKVFHQNINLEKLKSAAIKILKEDVEGWENLSSSEDGGCYLSSKKSETGNSTPAQTPHEFQSNLNDYNQYYESWADASRLAEPYQSEILPSKAFRLIQNHAESNKTGAVAGLLARCPRVLSNKNVQKELMKLIEMQNSLSSDPLEQILDSNDATNTP